MTDGTIICLFACSLVFVIFFVLGMLGFNIIIECLDPFSRFYTVYKALIVVGSIAYSLVLCLPFYQIVMFVQ